MQKTFREKLATEIENSDSWFELIRYTFLLLGITALMIMIQGLILFAFLYILGNIIELPTVTYWQCCLLMILGRIITRLLLPTPTTKS